MIPAFATWVTTEPNILDDTLQRFTSYSGELQGRLVNLKRSIWIHHYQILLDTGQLF